MAVGPSPRRDAAAHGSERNSLDFALRINIYKTEKSEPCFSFSPGGKSAAPTFYFLEWVLCSLSQALLVACSPVAARPCAVHTRSRAQPWLGRDLLRLQR